MPKTMKHFLKKRGNEGIFEWWNRNASLLYNNKKGSPWSLKICGFPTQNMWENHIFNRKVAYNLAILFVAPQIERKPKS